MAASEPWPEKPGQVDRSCNLNPDSQYLESSMQPPKQGPDVDVRHEDGRFLADVDGVEARLDYQREGERMLITSTSVPDEIGGRGIAGRLTRAAFEHARSQGWKVRPVCSYAAAWAERHPEFGDLLG